MLAAVILSAGASSRMGSPKALLPYREGTFLEHLIEITRHPRIGVTRVVLGFGAAEIRAIANVDDSIVVLNPVWEQGQLSSVHAALRNLAGIATDGILLCPVDHPLVSAALIGDLIGQFYGSAESNGKSIVLPVYRGQRGHPVIFSSALYEELLAAPFDKGARAVVWDHGADVLEVPTDEEGVTLNINDPDMLRNTLPGVKE